MQTDKTYLALSNSPPAVAARTRMLAAGAAFLLDSILPAEWTPPDAICELVTLTDAGTIAAKAAAAATPKANAAEIRLAVVIAFASPDAFLVDVDATDVDAFLMWLSDAVRTRNVQFPWLFGGDLYRAYANEIGTFERELDGKRTHALLHHLPQGVFQLDTLVAGPLGLLQSEAVRYLPSTRLVSAFACSRQGCAGDHSVRISTTETPTSEAFAAIARGYRDHPDASRRLVREHAFRTRDFSIAGAADNVSSLLADCLADAELRSVAQRALHEHPDLLRSALLRVNKPKKQVLAAPDAVVAGLSGPELMHLLHVLDTPALTSIIDQETRVGRIAIPGAEIRTLRTFLRSRALFGSQIALARYGVQFGSRQFASLRLHELGRFVHREEGTQGDLNWRLRGTTGLGPDERLRNFIHRAVPQEAIRDLVLVSEHHATAALRFPGLAGAAVYLDDPIDELAQAVAWKLGFDTFHPPSPVKHFQRRLRAVREISTELTGGTVVDEALRDRVRSEGVNIFISVEQLLDLTLTFACWALLWDHVAQLDAFTYNPSLARRYALSHLDGTTLGADTVLTLPTGGGLTLSVLALAFSAPERCLTDAGSETRELVPEWADTTPLLSFPFRHVAPFLDLSESAREEIGSQLQEVPATLARADVAGVRNRVDHWREEAHAGRQFPTEIEIGQVCDATETLVTALVYGGYCPTLFRRVSRTSDAYRRSRLEFESDFGGSLTLYEPTSLLLCGLPAANNQVVFSAAKLEGHDDCLRFRVREPSAYTQMWEKFPPVRLPHPLDEGEIEHVPPSAGIDPVPQSGGPSGTKAE